jgi:hypothetical protein
MKAVTQLNEELQGDGHKLFKDYFSTTDFSVDPFPLLASAAFFYAFLASTSSLTDSSLLVILFVGCLIFV